MLLFKTDNCRELVFWVRGSGLALCYCFLVKFPVILTLAWPCGKYIFSIFPRNLKLVFVLFSAQLTKRFPSVYLKFFHFKSKHLEPYALLKKNKNLAGNTLKFCTLLFASRNFPGRIVLFCWVFSRTDWHVMWSGQFPSQMISFSDDFDSTYFGKKVYCWW